MALSLAPACAPASQPTGPSPDQLLHSARQAYQSALTFHISFSFNLNGKHYQSEVDVHRPDAQGGEDIDSLHIEFLLTGGAVYRRGHDFFQQTSGERVAKLVGDGWVRAGDAQLAADWQRFIDPRLLDDFQGRHPNIRAGAMGTLHGYRTQKLLNGSRSIFVASSAPHYPVRIEDPNGESMSGGATNLELDFFDYGKSVSISMPASIVDLNDPATLPALFIATSIDASPCDRSGCTLKATLRNDGGPGTSTAAFTLESGGAVIDRCSAPIAAAPHNGTQEVSCRISSAAWSDWIDFHPGGTYQFRVKPSNPAYE